MRKNNLIFISLIMFLFSITLVIANDFDNVKRFEKAQGQPFGQITIINQFGRGETLAIYELLDNSDNCLLSCYAEGKVVIRSPDKLFRNIETRGATNSNVKIFLQDGVETIRIDSVNIIETCRNENLNGTQTKVCSQRQIVTPRTEVRKKWVLYDGSALKQGEYNWRIEVTKRAGQTIDWVGNAYGIYLDEWAFWTGVNPVAYWKFNEVFGNANDTMGMHNLTNNAGVTYITGLLNNSVSIAGSTNNAFTTPSSSDFAFGTENFTITFWINAPSEGSATSLLGTGSTEWDICRSCASSNSLTFRVGGTDLISTDNVQNGSYHSITIERHGTGANQASLYIDGRINKTFTMGSVSSSSEFKMLNGGGSGTAVEIDELSIFKGYAFNSGDALAFHNNGTGRELGDFSPTQALLVTLNSPANSATITTSTITFNATIAPSGNINVTNATLYLWYANGTFVRNVHNTTINANNIINMTFSTTANVSSYLWNVLAGGKNMSGAVFNSSFAQNNFTFTYGYSVNNHTFNNPVSEISSQTFNLNLSLTSALSTATFYYNNIPYASSKTTEGSNTIFSRAIVTPDVAVSQNISWIWQLILTDSGNVNYFNITGVQQVDPLSIDNCSVNTLLLLNYSLKDEDGQTFIVPSASQNITIEIEVNISSLGTGSASTIFARNYSNINPAQVCINQGALNATGYRLDAITRYESSNRVSEFHNIQNLTLSSNFTTQNINLYDLLVTRSQEFLITFKDENFLPLQDALIQINRKYIADGQFKSVEIPKTDKDGRTLGHFVLSEAIYTIIVTKNGKVLGTFPNVIAVCNNQATGDCKISLNAAGTSVTPSSFKNQMGLSYLPYYNGTLRTYSFTFFTIDGSTKTIALNVTLFDTNLTTNVCLTSLSSSSGTLTCNIPANLGNGTAIAKVTVDGNLLLTDRFYLRQSLTDILGYTRYFFAFLLIITLPLIAITSAPIAMLFFVIGLVMAGMLFLIDYGGVLGVSSAFTWLIIAVCIILWKISEGRNP